MTGAADRFGEVTAYATFIGSGRTGTSLLAAIIDAHPNAILSHQLQALRRVGRVTQRELFEQILDASRRHAHEGKRHYQYTYHIPGTWQGAYTTLRVIGDKYAGPDTARLARRDFSALHRLEAILHGLPLKFVHAVRNPYDAITTHKRRYYTLLSRAVATYVQREAIVQQIKDRGYAVHDVWIEDLTEDPRASIRALYQFLGLGVDEALVDRCASIVFARPRVTRFDIRWPSRWIAAVARCIDRHDWLAGYAYDRPGRRRADGVGAREPA